MPTPHEEFVRSLGPDDTLVVRMRDELYGGVWERMEQDLEARRKGRPYVFRLVNRIEEDLERIRRLRAYEQAHGINLRDVLPEED